LQLEIDDPKELTEAFFYEEIHPTKNLGRTNFAKPPGPQKRGARKLIKAPE